MSSSSPFSFSSSHVVVLGGTGNVGSGVVAAYLSAAASVVVVTRSSDKFSTLKATLEKYSIPTAHLKLVVGDFRTESEASQVAEKSFASLGGKIDHVVSNLGFGHITQGGPTAATSSIKDVMENLDNGFFNAYQAAKAFIPLLRKQDIDVSYTITQAPSQHGLHAVSFWGPAVKGHALKALLLGLAAEQADSKVRVNTVCIHSAVAAIGQTKNQWQYEGTDGRELAPVYLALAENKTKRGENVCAESSKYKEVTESVRTSKA